ncbi:hypothetical protein BH10PSE19_BH10PSE19_08090 [soil metagenome]
MSNPSKYGHPILERLQPWSMSFLTLCCWIPLLLISPHVSWFFFAGVTFTGTGVLSNYFGTYLSIKLSRFLLQHPQLARVLTVVTLAAMALVSFAFYAALLSNPISSLAGLLLLLTPSSLQTAITIFVTMLIVIFSSALATAFSHRPSKAELQVVSIEPIVTEKTGDEKDALVNTSTPSIGAKIVIEEKALARPAEEDGYKTPPRRPRASEPSSALFTPQNPYRVRGFSNVDSKSYKMTPSPFKNRPTRKSDDQIIQDLQDDILHKLLLAEDESSLLELATDFAAMRNAYKIDPETLTTVISLNYPNETVSDMVTQSVAEHLNAIGLVFEHEINTRIVAYELLEVLRNIARADPVRVAALLAHAATFSPDTLTRIRCLCNFPGDIKQFLEEDDEKAVGLCSEPTLIVLSDYLIENNLAHLNIENMSLPKLAQYVEACFREKTILENDSFKRQAPKRTVTVVHEQKDVTDPIVREEDESLLELSADLINDSCTITLPNRMLLHRAAEEKALFSEKKYSTPSQAQLLQLINSQAAVLVAKKNINDLLEKLLDEKLSGARVFVKLIELKVERDAILRPLKNYYHLISFNYLNQGGWLTLPFDQHIARINCLFATVELQQIVNGIGPEGKIPSFLQNKLRDIIADLTATGILKLEAVIPKMTPTTVIMYKGTHVELEIHHHLVWIMEVLRGKNPYRAIEEARCKQEWQNSEDWDPEVEATERESPITLPDFS